MHAILYGPKTAAGWPATGLSLQVNNTITYNFVNQLQHNLPYNWQVPTPVLGTVGLPQGEDYINLPYNNAAAQTVGFTIPQDIVDNGLVLAYIRYFNGSPSDNVTDANLGPWMQLPLSTAYEITDPTSGETAIVPINIVSTFDDNGFYIKLSLENPGAAPYYVSANIPAVIRIVLIPENQVNTIQ